MSDFLIKQICIIAPFQKCHPTKNKLEDLWLRKQTEIQLKDMFSPPLILLFFKMYV